MFSSRYEFTMKWALAYLCVTAMRLKYSFRKPDTNEKYVATKLWLKTY